MHDCRNCGKPTEYKNGLCTDCYNQRKESKKKGGDSTFSVDVVKGNSSSTGLSDKVNRGFITWALRAV